MTVFKTRLTAAGAVVFFETLAADDLGREEAVDRAEGTEFRQK